MAAFRVHEDVQNYLSRNKMADVNRQNKMPLQGIQQKKHFKEFAGVRRRKPLHTTNNIISKTAFVPAEKKKSAQIEPQIKIYADSPKRCSNIADENGKKCENVPQILNDISDFPHAENKENAVPNHEKEEISFPLDNIYLSTAEYHDSIFRYLIYLEKTLRRPKPDYMEKQPELTYKMRTILVDWLAAVSEEYTLQPQTLHLAVHYIDSFLSRMSVVKNKFQLVGTAAMMIAAKYEEIYPPETKEWAYLTADSFTPKQLLRMEQLILKVLQFDLAQPTAYSFITHICGICKIPKTTMLLAMYFSELVLLEGNEYIQYFPSQLAFSAIALARHTMGVEKKEVWPKKLETVTGYSLKQLSPIIKKQHKSFQDSPTRSQQAIQDKYKTVKYGSVSLFKPRNLQICDLE